MAEFHHFHYFLITKDIFWYLNSEVFKEKGYYSINLVNAPCLIKAIDKNFVIAVDNVLWEIYIDRRGIPYFSSSNPIKVKQVSCSSSFFFLICEDNSLWSHGKNKEGQLGLGNCADTNQPTKLEINEIFISISCGECHTLLLNRFNKVFACGSNKKGQIGLNNCAFSAYHSN